MSNDHEFSAKFLFSVNQSSDCTAQTYLPLEGILKRAHFLLCVGGTIKFPQKEIARTHLPSVFPMMSRLFRRYISSANFVQLTTYTS